MKRSGCLGLSASCLKQPQLIDNMDEKERQVKGIWIPIEIWKDPNLSWNEKILFLEIDSFTTTDKDCFISNEYISKLLGVGETTANKILSSLINKGYVIKTRFDGRRRYVKSALHFSTSQGCTLVQGWVADDDKPLYNIYNNNKLLIQLTKNKNTKENNKKKDEKDELFEKCWIAYRRKGSKGKSKPYWDKLTNEEKEMVLPHIRAYVESREVRFQKDFERYLRDKIFKSVVYKDNNVSYDPSMFIDGKYMPQGFDIWYDEDCGMYCSMDNFYDERIYDGYTDENRPDGAKIKLNNARGVIVWDKKTKKWNKY